MIAFTTLVRRTATALSAIAALTATGVATAQSITLSGASGNTCTYSSMSVSPNGNFTVSCTSSTSPGLFTITAVTSLSTNSTSTSAQIRVNRTGGSSGAADVPFTASGECSASTVSPLSFGDGDAVAKSIIVDTTANPGTCTVALQTPTAGSLGSAAQVTKNIQVVDPDAPVVFGFAADTSNSAVGGQNTQIVVTRTGGSNNAWSVPVTLSGSLTLAGNIIAGAGAIAPATLNFPAGSSQAILTFDPPNATPGSPPLPATLLIGLGTPTSATAPAGQTGSISATDRTHTLTLTGPAVGCPAEQTAAADLGGAGKLSLTRLTSGIIGTFTLPTLTSTRASSGQFKLSETTSSWPIAPWSYEIHINKCRGLVQPSTSDACYKVSGNKTLFAMVWFAKLAAAPYNSAAAITAAGHCYAPASDGPWYINIRYNYSSCTTPPCGWHAQWQNYAY